MAQASIICAMTTNANLYAQFFSRFPANLEQTLLSTPERVQFSYADAISVSARIANTLLDAGAKAGDRVTVQVHKSPNNLFLYLACLRAGLVYHPLNTAYQTSELEYFLDNAEPSLIVCDPACLAQLKQLAPSSVHAVLSMDSQGLGSLSDAAENRASELPCAVNKGGDMAALLYSSGTTGKPKGIVLTHDNLYTSAKILTELWGFTSQDVLLHALPIYHVHGLFVATGCVFMSGASMLWLNKYDDQSAAEQLPNCSVMMGVPTYYTRLLNNRSFTRDCCQTMRLFISGSAPLLAETFIEFKNRSGHAILERYGMTETNMSTSNPLDGERRAGTVGFPLPGVELRIVNEQERALPVGETGNLQVKGRNVFPGYWRMPDKTAEDFTEDGFFNTGDKAQIDTEGYISIVGRSKDMIICGGLNVYPKEIELVLDELPGVIESAVIGIAHDDLGEAVVAVIVGNEQALPVDTVLDYSRQHLANFKIPKQVHFIEALPRNAMGKVQKNLLREQFSRR